MGSRKARVCCKNSFRIFSEGFKFKCLALPPTPTGLAPGIHENSPAIYGWVKGHEYKSSPVRDERISIQRLRLISVFLSFLAGLAWLV